MPQRENHARLLDQVSSCMRLRHMSRRTEVAYQKWIVDFLHFHKELAGNWQHPKDQGGCR